MEHGETGGIPEVSKLSIRGTVLEAGDPAVPTRYGWPLASEYSVVCVCSAGLSI